MTRPAAWRITGWSRGEGLFQPRGPAARRCRSRRCTCRATTSRPSASRFRSDAGFTPADDGVARRAGSGHQPPGLADRGSAAIRTSSGAPSRSTRPTYIVVGVAPEGVPRPRGGLDDGALPALAAALASSAPDRHAATARSRPRHRTGCTSSARLRRARRWRRRMRSCSRPWRRWPRAIPSTTRDKTGGVEPYFPAGARLRSADRLVARLMLLGLSGIVLLVVGLNISGHDAGPQRDAASASWRSGWPWAPAAGASCGIT